MFSLARLGGALALAATLGGAPSFAITTFDANVTPDVIFGSGNANGSWTVDTAGEVELGLRAKLRFDAFGNPQNIFNSNGDGTYSFAAGVAPTKAFPTAVWSVEWSVNSAVSGAFRALNALTYAFGIDSDASQGTSFSVFDMINVPFADHSLGNNLSGNGSGVEDFLGYSGLLSIYNVAQNSQQAHWIVPSFDPTVDGTYDFYLAAYDDSGAQLARTSIQVIVGRGGAAVPDSGASFALAGLALLGLLGLRRRLQR